MAEEDFSSKNEDLKLKTELSQAFIDTIKKACDLTEDISTDLVKFELIPPTKQQLDVNPGHEGQYKVDLGAIFDKFPQTRDREDKLKHSLSTLLLQASTSVAEYSLVEWEDGSGFKLKRTTMSLDVQAMAIALESAPDEEIAKELKEREKRLDPSVYINLETDAKSMNTADIQEQIDEKIAQPALPFYFASMMNKSLNKRQFKKQYAGNSIPTKSNPKYHVVSAESTLTADMSETILKVAFAFSDGLRQQVRAGRLKHGLSQIIFGKYLEIFGIAESTISTPDSVDIKISKELSEVIYSNPVDTESEKAKIALEKFKLQLVEANEKLIAKTATGRKEFSEPTDPQKLLESSINLLDRHVTFKLSRTPAFDKLMEYSNLAQCILYKHNSQNVPCFTVHDSFNTLTEAKTFNQALFTRDKIGAVICQQGIRVPMVCGELLQRNKKLVGDICLTMQLDRPINTVKLTLLVHVVSDLSNHIRGAFMTGTEHEVYSAHALEMGKFIFDRGHSMLLAYTGKIGANDYTEIQIKYVASILQLPTKNIGIAFINVVSPTLKQRSPDGKFYEFLYKCYGGDPSRLKWFLGKKTAEIKASAYHVVKATIQLQYVCNQNCRIFDPLYASDCANLDFKGALSFHAITLGMTTNYQTGLLMEADFPTVHALVNYRLGPTMGSVYLKILRLLVAKGRELQHKQNNKLIDNFFKSSTIGKELTADWEHVQLLLSTQLDILGIEPCLSPEFKSYRFRLETVRMIMDSLTNPIAIKSHNAELLPPLVSTLGQIMTREFNDLKVTNIRLPHVIGRRYAYQSVWMLLKYYMTLIFSSKPQDSRPFHVLLVATLLEDKHPEILENMCDMLYKQVSQNEPALHFLAHYTGAQVDDKLLHDLKTFPLFKSLIIDKAAETLYEEVYSFSQDAHPELRA